MTGKELKKLGRPQLLELLVAQAKEMEGLKERLAEAEAQLAKRQIAIDKAGSIAEASLALSGIFEAAEEAVAQYMENIKELSGRQEKIYIKKEEENRKKAEEILEKAQRGADLLLNSTREECRRMEEDTRKQCQRLEEDTRKRCEYMLSSARQEANGDIINLPVQRDEFFGS